MVGPWQIGSDVHEMLYFFCSEWAAPVVVPSAKEDVCQKGGGPGPPKSQCVRCAHMKISNFKKVNGQKVLKTRYSYAGEILDVF
jgi:hypothetical protein